jgi:hypothetical protein
MSLTARQDKAAEVLEQLEQQLKLDVVFTRDSTAFDMGVQQERKRLLQYLNFHKEKR